MYSELLYLLKQNNIVFTENEIMKQHTSFKIGGEVDVFVTPKSSEECSKIISFCGRNNIPYIVIGKGTNLLVSDDGFRGVVICISSLMSNIRLVGENKIYCEAGASLSAICSFAFENSLGGMEFAYGIPGNIGGAVPMNAGAYGGEMKDIVVSCEYIDELGILNSINSCDIDFEYRKSFFSNKNYCIVSVMIQLQKVDKYEIREKMQDFMRRRKDKQPLEFPSAGSTFKRPEGSYASLLIDQCGLKGMRVGGAMVSQKHAGFVINYDNATCNDVKELMKQVKKIVYSQTGFVLQPEVKII